MKEQLALLRELQRIDLQLDKLEEQKAEIQNKLEENQGFLNKLVEDLENQKEELLEVKKLRRQKKDDVKETRQELDDKQQRLNEVTSAKEYNAVETEIEILKTKLDQTEEELLNLEEVIESTEASIEEKEEKIVQLREGIANEVAEAEGEIAELDAEIKKRQERTEEARSEVSKRVLHKYDFIRSRRPGLAVVPAKDGHCEGCYMEVPPQQFIEIQRGDTLEICPNCQRILYYWEDAVDEDTAMEELEAAGLAK